MARSEVNFIYDAAAAFRAPGLAALTASAVVGTFTLDKLTNVRPSSQRNKLGAEGYKIVIVVETLDKTTGDETYQFVAETGAAGGATVEVGSISVVSTGQYVLALDSASIEKLNAAHEVLELNLVAAGTTPSIKFSAWIV